MDALPFNSVTIAATSTASLLTTLLTHPWRRLTKNTHQSRSLFYDSVFSTVKNFIAKAGLHTVEELQRVSKLNLPSPPGVRVVPCTIPLQSRLDAGKILIETIGQEEIVRVVGGTEWWQKSASPLNGEWVSMKKDWQGPEPKERGRTGWAAMAVALDKSTPADARSHVDPPSAGPSPVEGQSTTDAPPAPGSAGVDEYDDTLEETSCVLFLHGGAGFFGSVNTHRSAVWRLARKTSGRVFALEYRLAPQYPFPCPLLDALAAYLYLIRGGEGSHRPVDPAKLTIMGDSFGGGLALALMVLIRDAGLPAPAAGVLISPWVDLTHSFPSILTSTETDYIPPHGFLFRPSTLWPPPPADFIARANEPFSLAPHPKRSFFNLLNRKGTGMLDDAAVETPEGLPVDEEQAEVVKVEIDGKMVELRDQIQLYATNSQLTHPYVSPMWFPNLGGLPNLYVLAGDHEVLRDEIIYMAHRAANPAQYPLRDALLTANPARTAHAQQFLHQPTNVHLQVYDKCPHDILLFGFLSPGKYAFRAIASFIKASVTPNAIPPIPESPAPSPLSTSPGGAPLAPTRSRSNSLGATIRRTLTFSDDTTPKAPRVLRGLDKTIYSHDEPHLNRPEYVDHMVRERVSWEGEVRAMESREEMSVLSLDKETLGMIKGPAASRYLEGKKLYDKRFSVEKVRQRREHHLSKSRVEEAARIRNRNKTKGAALDGITRTESPEQLEGIWELHGERPPPSSIAARKDTREARELAAVLERHYSRINALHLWTEAQDLVQNKEP